MSFGIALSGLNAAQTELNVTANNIANSATTGFKQSRSEFAELFAVSPYGVSRNAHGNGVKVGAVSQQFTQGDINTTNNKNSMDLALSGQGFFILSDGGSTAYTRAGAFKMNNAGYVVNNQEQRLQVYPPSTTGNFNTSTLADLRLVTSESPPSATTNVETVFNLPSSDTVPTTTPFDPADESSYNIARSMTVYDSLGAAHTTSLYYVKTASNEWDMHVSIDGNQLGTQHLIYDQDGNLSTPANGQAVMPVYDAAAGLSTGAAPLNLTFDVGRTTQFGEEFTMTSITQDGYTTGRLIGIGIDSTGVVQARFTNGRSTPLGQLAIANFSNPQGLQQLGDTNWAQTNASGQPLNGQAGNSGFGLVQSGALEASNVDITAQLVNMITAQRNFQANAQMIQTSDQITQTIINIR